MTDASKLLSLTRFAGKLLPEWGKSLVELGFRIGDWHQEGRRNVIGMILPALDYAAPLIALGCVVAQSRRMLEDTWKQRRFEYLWSLEDGSGCFYFEGGYRYKGVIFEHLDHTVFTERKLKVKYAGKSAKSTGTFVYATPKLAHLFQPSEKAFHISINPKPQKVEVPSIFEEMHNFLGMQLARISDMACLVIGPLDRFEDELSHPVSIESSGQLGDLIIPLSQVGNKAIYRSEVWFQQHDDDPPLITPETPVIFNGSRAFLESEQDWRFHNIVVLLSSTDPKFEEALKRVKFLYERRRESPQPDFLSTLPSFMEVTYFSQRAIRD